LILTFIDTHVHLTHEKYEIDRIEVIHRAIDHGIEQMLDIGTDIQTSQAALCIAQSHPEVYAAVGIHPHDASEIRENDWKTLASLIKESKVIAIGEVGLDYYYDFSPRDHQKDVFRKQLEIASEFQIPLIIHVREAMKDALDVIDSVSRSSWKGVFHCFGGNLEDVPKVLDRGFHVGFMGVITFKNFKGSDIVRAVPMDRLLVETDSPYMSPVPYRGKRNEPIYVKQVAEAISEIKNIPLREVAEKTTANAKSLFGLGD